MAVDDAACLDLLGEGVGGCGDGNGAEEPGVEGELGEKLEGWGDS